MEPKLASWSWQEIQGVYITYGKQLKEYERIKKSLGLDKVEPEIENSESRKNFIEWFVRDVKKIDASIAELDREIARRNNLIGVVG